MQGSEPAFPETKIIGMHGEMVGTANTSGISTRLYVATKMMQALVPQWGDYSTNDMAKDALTLADALIAACEEKPNAQ